MKKTSIILLSVVTAALWLASCREKSDSLLPYDRYDIYNYGYASFFYEDQFKAFWTAMNCNYAMWDYEAQFGIDWDDTYDRYLPKFRELDQRDSAASDKEFFALYEEIVRPLHDGHLAIQVKNVKNGSYSGIIMPSEIRNRQERPGEMEVPETNLDYYLSDKAGENAAIEHARMRYYDSFLVNPHKTHNCQYALFPGNIAYYQLSDFNLSDFRKKAGLLEKQEELDSVIAVRDQWLAKIRELHRQNTLGGIIIDVRNNGGGYADDYQFVLGSLQAPSQEFSGVGYYEIGRERYKTGVGRLDYSSLMLPCMFKLGTDREEVADVPIVILANCNTSSAAEMTCLGAKTMANGYVIGRRTWGALSSLNATYTDTYTGTIGKKDENVFFMYIPKTAFHTAQGEILEGKGIEPDIDVRLDERLYETTGRDTQLERALEFIRSGS